MDIYLVGGAVRDQLLKLPVHERDWVVVGATPSDLLELGYCLIGKDFPVFLHPQTKEEYALARTERKTGHGYKGFSVNFDPSITLEADLARRDLTMNAIAQATDGTFIDPYGGKEDIDTKVLRHVSPAFREDPVRILRIARFAARFHHLGFTIAENTLALMQTMVISGEAQHLVPERIWKEMSRALCGKTPEIFFQSLESCGALEAIIPELFEAHPSNPKIPTIINAIRYVSRASESAKVRFTALFINFNKTNIEQNEAQIKDNLTAIKQLCTRICAPKEYRELALFIGEFYRDSCKAVTIQPTKILTLLKRTDAFRRPERFEDFLLCCRVCLGSETNGNVTNAESLDFLHAVYLLCSKVDIQEIIAQGFKNAAISQELDKTMLAIIKHNKNDN